MADDFRALERRLAQDPTDQATLARALAARRRAGLPAPRRLLDARVLPPRTFTTSHELDGCRELGDDGLAVLARGLPRLAHLDLRIGERLTARGLGALRGLERLRRLRLAHCEKVGDAALPHLAKLPALEALDLQHCPVGDAGAAALARAPRLAQLDLEATEVGPKGLVALARARTPLRELSLGEADDALLAAAAGLAGLRSLRFDAADDLTADGLAALAALPELEDLHVLLPKRLGPKAVKPLRAARPGLRLHGELADGGNDWGLFEREA